VIADPDVIQALLPPGLSVARFHGTIAGLLCAEGANDSNAGLLARALRELLGVGDDEVSDALLDVVAETATGLDSFELEFELMLPEDEAPMAERLAGLAEWCGAFVGAFRSADAILDDEAEEALADLDAIAELDAEGEADEDDEVELDFAAVVEHVRVAVLLLHASTRADDDDADDDSEESFRG
jgi:uncharacterized protein YgfB (UPF0149 family)